MPPSGYFRLPKVPAGSEACAEEALNITLVRPDGTKPLRFTLRPGGVVRIGRGQGNDCSVAVPNASLYHCDLLCLGGGTRGAMQLCVRNSSKNGTGVRSADARTSPWTALAPGNLCIIDHGWQMLVPLKGGLGQDRKSLVDRVLVVLVDRRELLHDINNDSPDTLNDTALAPTLVVPATEPWFSAPGAKAEAKPERAKKPDKEKKKEKQKVEKGKPKDPRLEKEKPEKEKEKEKKKEKKKEEKVVSPSKDTESSDSKEKERGRRNSVADKRRREASSSRSSSSGDVKAKRKKRKERSVSRARRRR